MKIFTKKALAALVILTAIPLLIIQGRQSKTTQPAPVEQETVERVVIASGLVKPKNIISLQFPNSGKLISLKVEEGDTVFTGQVIASIDPEKYQIALRQAEQDVNAADALLSQVYDEAKKYTAAENFDQKIRRTNAETAKNKAFDAMKLAQKNLRETTILAPTSGTITNVTKTVGEEITAGTQIGQLASENNKFVAQVDESEISAIKIGQHAEITLDSLPNETFTTQVAKIASQATVTTTGATVFEITLNLPKSGNIKIGATGEAQIIK